MSENRVFRRIFGPRREEVTGEWRILHNGSLMICTAVLLTQYCAGDQIENNEMGGACNMYGVGERRIRGFGGETCR
jgi:hypothetical protein